MTDREAEARQNGGCQCPKCRTWNLQHRKVCVRCGKRLKPSATMIRQEAERFANAPADARSIGKTVEIGGRKFVMTKGKKQNG